MAAPVGQLALLGAVHGLSTLLPISWSGHRALFRLLFQEPHPGTDVVAALDVGTLVSMLIVLRRPVLAAIMDAISVLRPARVSGSASPEGDALLVIACVGPAAAVGLLLNRLSRAVEMVPVAVALGFLSTGALLVSSRWAHRLVRDRPSAIQALLVGVAQGLCVFPGMSATAVTVVLLLWFGVRPLRSFELSMLLSLPSATAVVLLDVAGIEHLSVPPFVLAFPALGSFIGGAIALTILRRSLIRGTFAMFASWVVPVGLSTLALAWAWPARP